VNIALKCHPDNYHFTLTICSLQWPEEPNAAEDQTVKSRGVSASLPQPDLPEECESRATGEGLRSMIFCEALGRLIRTTERPQARKLRRHSLLDE
jgi:hypothetical protein